mmetsp:Transcript_56478/g.143093  ORF Transcript_56478/g.143093 Transcript_56478/m.143093 type:complete len:200 (-) Transcript_56478:69-668(-)
MGFAAASSGRMLGASYCHHHEASADDQPITQMSESSPRRSSGLRGRPLRRHAPRVRDLTVVALMAAVLSTLMQKNHAQQPGPCFGGSSVRPRRPGRLLAEAPKVARLAATLPPPGPPGPQGDGGEGDEDDKTPKFRMASLGEAAEAIGKTTAGVSDMTRKASFEFRKTFGVDGALVIGALLVGSIIWEQTDLRYYLGFF